MDNWERIVSKAKRVVSGVCIAVVLGGLGAQAEDWQPSPGHVQVPIWPGTPPDARATKHAEFTDWGGVVAIQDVTRPTMTVYPAKGTNTGAAVVVFPGGGYKILAMDLEGTEVCDWLTLKGITCVLLKYRVPGNEYYPGAGPIGDAPGCRKSGAYPCSPIALDDAQRTLSLVRSRASEWHVDPHKIGVLGFSAGGHLAAAMSTHWAKRVYEPVDSVDKESCRPDFAVALYPGHLWNEPLGLNPDIQVNAQTPPQLVLQAEDDPVDDVRNSLVYYLALKKAGVPVEMHLYAHGGHGFGLRRTQFPITAWPQLAETWLGTIGMVPK
jgi:acetyl esterase/lipase